VRIFTAGIVTETNTFAPWPTGERGFSQGGMWHGDASASGHTPQNLVARLWRDQAARDGHDFVESLFAVAEPSGPTVQSVYEAMRDEILADIRHKGPFDVVLLLLHGAMVATECDDCETDLVARVRAIVGPQAAIGVELDPHCHLSQALLDVADAVILMKEYPHTDFLPRAEELYRLCVAKAAGELALTSRLFDCRMVGFYPTTSEPMAGLVAAMRAAEQRPGVLSVSFAHGFPWGDTFDTGSKMLAITDEDSHRSHFFSRGAEPGAMRSMDRYLRRLGEIRRIQEYLVARAEKQGWPVIEAGDPDDALLAVMDLILERATAHAAAIP